MKANFTLCTSLLISTFVSVAPLHAGTTSTQAGFVRSGGSPISSATVTLYRAGDLKGSGEIVLGSAVTNSKGAFSIQYTPPDDPSAVLYLIADGPAAAVRLATVLGTAPFPRSVTINERTTVATANALAQFIVDGSIGGKSPGLRNAAGTFRNLVDLASGDVGTVLGSAPNGTETSTMPTFNSLANILAGCVSEQSDCEELFEVATPPGGDTPSDTLQAALNIAHYPWWNTEPLFELSEVFAPYQPARADAPEAWALAIKYIGNGREFDGAGNTAFDAQGNVWITNNYVYRKNHSVPACGAKLVSKLTPTGLDAPGTPIDGKKAGIDGDGFGVTIDPDGNVWIGNFGFFGSTCPENLRPLANSVSRFSPDGEQLCPDGGFTQGCINAPQGTVSDPAGNIWIANTCGGTVTQYVAGNPDNHWVFDISTGELADSDDCPPFHDDRPFGIAIDADGNAWITNNTGDYAFKLSPDGTLIGASGPEAGIARPLGVAIDSIGNVWVSNSAIIEVPCANQDEPQEYGELTPGESSVTKLSSDGTFLGNFTGGGMRIPWGIAVDGNDNIWVADFDGLHLTQLNGATGDPIAPNGYRSDALVRNTAVSIDPSGNVWVCNNWLIDPVQTNPGGDGMVVFIGLAGPVKTPMMGPPQQP
jgi:sugar lactone lactonase YvrE